MAAGYAKLFALLGQAPVFLPLSKRVTEKLKRDKLIQATREAMKLPPADVPGWETPEAASKWVHDCVSSQTVSAMYEISL